MILSDTARSMRHKDPAFHQGHGHIGCSDSHQTKSRGEGARKGHGEAPLGTVTRVIPGSRTTNNPSSCTANALEGNEPTFPALSLGLTMVPWEARIPPSLPVEVGTEHNTLPEGPAVSEWRPAGTSGQEPRGDAPGCGHSTGKGRGRCSEGGFSEELRVKKSPGL